MLKLISSVAKLATHHQGTQVKSGTAWFLAPDLLLTAAHCIGDRDQQAPCGGPFEITLPGQGTRAATLLRQDFLLDAALLKLDQPVPGVSPLPPGRLPEHGAPPRWYSYGFPRAHGTGLHVDGDITSPHGNVDGQPAIQLRCQQGGRDHLEGISGAPVCVGEQVVGLIRFGPPRLGQLVILATAIADLVPVFPEVKLASAVPTKRAVRLFISYAEQDADLLKELETHLALLKRQGLIESWTDRPILASQPFQGQIDPRLEEADIVLLLLSGNFMASDYCYQGEMQRAMQLHESGEVRVIPVSGRPADLTGAPFIGLVGLPSRGGPVTSWRDRDSAWVDVVKGIRGVVTAMQERPPRAPAFQQAQAVDRAPQALPTAPGPSSPAPPTRESLRRLIEALIPTEDDLDAFCINYFLAVRRQFHGGMRYTGRVNELLLRADPQQIADRLRQAYSDAWPAHQHLLKYP